MDTEIEEVKQEIRKVEQEIRKVEQQIDDVEGRLVKAATEADVAYWRKKEEQLRKKEEQLRKEKEQLRKKEEQLRKKEEQLRKKEEQLRNEKELLLKAATSEPPSKKKKSAEAQLNYYKALLEDHGELPQSVDDIKKFLSKTTVQLPVSGKTHSTLGVNLHDLVMQCSMEEGEDMSNLTVVETAFLFDFQHPRNEATSSSQLFFLTGHFLSVLNRIAPAGCALRNLETTLDSADTSSKSALSALASKLRPDCLVYVRQVLMLRWENKIDPSEMALARDENAEKLKVWSPLYYGALPYVIGGCCGGASFMWLKLSPHGEKIIVDPLLEYDLSTPRGVASFLHSTVRMHCLLQKLQEKLTGFPPICLYKPIPRSNGGQVVVCPYKVIKKIIPPLDVKKVQALYDSITSSSYLIQLLSIQKRRASTVLELQPVGDPNSRPHDLKDLGNATHDILRGLADLHQQGYTHRDLRWENCIKVNVHGEWKWVLIDLEAAECDEEVWDELRSWDAGTLADRTGKKLYTKGSDIYQLGKLIVEWLDLFGKGGEEEQAMRTRGKIMQEQRGAAAKILEEFCKNGCTRCGKFDKKVPPLPSYTPPRTWEREQAQA